MSILSSYRNRLIVAILVSFIVTIIYPTTLSYSELNAKSNILLQVWFCESIILGFILLYFSEFTLSKSIIAVVAGLVLSVMVRVIYDGFLIDPTHHNLWPLEVAIAVFIGGTGSLSGSLLGKGLQFAFKKKKESA